MRQIGCVFATLAFIILCKWKFFCLNSSSLIAIGVQSLHRLFIYEDVFENHSGFLAFEGEWTRDLKGSFISNHGKELWDEPNQCLCMGRPCTSRGVLQCPAEVYPGKVCWLPIFIRYRQIGTVFIWGLSWGMLYVKVLFDRRTFRLTKWQIS